MMNRLKNILPALLLVLAVPQGLVAMEKSNDGQKKSSSLKELLFSKKGAAVVTGGALAGVAWLTWTPDRSQQVNTLLDTAGNHKGKVAACLFGAGLLYGAYRYLSQPAQKPKVATVTWKPVEERANVEPTLPPLMPQEVMPMDSSPTISTESEEEPLIMDEPQEAPAKVIPQWMVIFIQLCEELYSNIPPAQQAAIATPVLQMAAKDPFDLLMQPQFMVLLETNEQKAVFYICLEAFMATYFDERMNAFMERNGQAFDGLPEPQHPHDLVNNELYSARLKEDQKRYLTELFAQMANYQQAHALALQKMGISLEVVMMVMQAAQPQEKA